MPNQELIFEMWPRLPGITRESRERSQVKLAREHGLAIAAAMLIGDLQRCGGAEERRDDGYFALTSAQAPSSTVSHLMCWSR